MRRQSLVCLLKSSPDFEVLGECSEGYELLNLLDSLGDGIILADSNLHTTGNLDTVLLVHQKKPLQRVIILSDDLSPLPAIRAIRNGARGYIVRLEDSEQFMKGIFKVFHDQRYVSEVINSQILDALVEGKSLEDEDERISSREKEILLLIAQGKSNSDIGELLVISPRTVETHRNNIMRKLGLSSVKEIISYAYKHGLLRAE
jgi:DNA-binding NarL/FixJ family response regulator